MTKVIYGIKTMLRFLQKLRTKVNRRMKEKYAANFIGLSAAIMCA